MCLLWRMVILLQIFGLNIPCFNFCALFTRYKLKETMLIIAHSKHHYYYCARTGGCGEEWEEACSFIILRESNYPYIVSSLLPLLLGKDFQSQRFTFSEQHTSVLHLYYAGIQQVDMYLVEIMYREYSGPLSTQGTVINWFVKC